MPQENRIANFDYLRLFLALEVPLLHANRLQGHLSFQVPIDPVPAFVCLSGFLIPDSFARSESWGHFAWKRVLRVYPAFFASLLLCLLLLGPASVWASMVAYLGMGFVALATVKNASLWSLMLEEVLYASHAVTRRLNAWRPIMPLMGFAACLGGWYLWRDNPNADHALLAASAYFLGNVAGMHKALIARVSGSSLVACLGVLVAAGYVVGFGSGWLGVIVPAASLVCVVAALQLPQIKWAILDCSYSIYLYHLPVMHWLRGSEGLSGDLLLPATLALVIPLSIASAKYVELPALKYKHCPPRLHFWKARRAETVDAAYVQTTDDGDHYGIEQPQLRATQPSILQR